MDKSGYQLKNKIILLYVGMALLPCLIIGIGSYLVYNKSITSKINTIVEDNTRRDIQVIGERLGKNKNILYNMVTDKELLSLVRKLDMAQKDEEYTCKSKILDKIQTFSSIYDDINSIAYISFTDNYVLYDKKLGDVHTFWEDKTNRDYFYRNTCSENGLTYFPTRRFAENRGDTIYSFFIAHPLKDTVTGKLYGIIVNGIDESMFRYTQISDQQYREYTEQLGITSYIIDDRNNVISAEDGAVIGTDFSQLFEDSESYKLFNSAILDTQWSLVQRIDSEILLRDVNLFTRICFLILLVVILLFIAVTITITNKLTISIAKTARYIGEYKPGVAMERSLQDEGGIYTIIRQFDKVRACNEELISELLHKNYEITEISDRKRKAELKALEAQINPHFLYNTLDSINWIAIENEQEEISQMLSTLGSLLRYSVTNIDMLVPLEVELEWMKKYTFLQQKRFCDSFSCQFEIALDTLSFPIYKMLLQPIVENIILHGFQELKSGGIIYVKSEIIKDNRLQILIKDNGRGMESGILSKIKSDLQNKNPLNSDSIGISNIVNRIDLYYKGEAEMHVSSEIGRGTECILVIPKAV